MVGAYVLQLGVVDEDGEWNGTLAALEVYSDGDISTLPGRRRRAGRLEAYTRTLSGSLSWSDVANENDSMAFEFMGPGIAMAAVG